MDASQVVAQIVAGGYHTCAVFTNGTAKCWGENADGELGYGDVATTRGAVDVPAASGTLEVSDDPSVMDTTMSAGNEHTCALLSDSSVKCWGSNSKGQLGYGSATPVGAQLEPSQVGPVPITSTGGISQIACGAYHTCAVLTDGTATCWGDNHTGQLGLGNVTTIGDDETPASLGSISITIDPTIRVSQIVAGFSHTCAKLSDNSVHCWGSASQLGTLRGSNLGDSELPSTGEAAMLTDAQHADVPTHLSAGSFHTCATFASGSMKCWGENQFGELGQGNLQAIGVTDFPSDIGMIGVSDAQLGTAVSAFVAGNFVSCANVVPLHAVDPESFYCWGWNEYGQLGRGDTFTLGDTELPTAQGPLKLF